ncbi:YqzE family protein [Lentibacillus sp. L22]|uniref:YqzE family protein n=1 Tax=Lentibacillus TaxID=175304 RepID=UPI0022B1966B|nr:YqzE family protein [Lentibacillus daqui]
MSGNDIVKYVTEKAVTYMNTPAEHRRKKRIKDKPKQQANLYSNRWLGVLPFAVKSIMKKE